jgi:hypothetical protein
MPTADFQISSFLNKMTKDGLRPNLFDIELHGLNSNWSSLYDTNQNIKFKARATSIPGSSLGTVGLYYFGRPMVFAGNRTYDPWTIAVIMDETDYNAANGGIRGLFEKWVDFLNGNLTNSRHTAAASPTIGTENGYFCNGIVNHYSKTGDCLATYRMENCFPVAISPLTLDWGANGSIAEFQVTFAMHYWQRMVSGTTTNPDVAVNRTSNTN